LFLPDDSVYGSRYGRLSSKIEIKSILRSRVEERKNTDEVFGILEKIKYYKLEVAEQGKHQLEKKRPMK
jgi:hypothetical protein